MHEGQIPGKRIEPKRPLLDTLVESRGDPVRHDASGPMAEGVIGRASPQLADLILVMPLSFNPSSNGCNQVLIK